MCGATLRVASRIYSIPTQETEKTSQNRETGKPSNPCPFFRKLPASALYGDRQNRHFNPFGLDISEIYIYYEIELTETTETYG